MSEFVVHAHRAKKAGLHYDLRIKIGDRLKDWAFRKPLPEGPGVKRLGIEQEEHDPMWLTFEGEIEDGYGAGRMEIWDKGEVDLMSVKDSKIVCNFRGGRLKGKHVLLKSEKLNGWLLWKTEKE